MIKLDSKYSTTAEYLSLFCMIALTVVAIFNKTVSVFYIIYLFWWDEFLKTVFDTLRYWFKKDLIENVSGFTSNTRGRMFFLLIYIVFIVVFFGLMLDWGNLDLVGSNFQTFFFRNALFNFTLLGLFLRELYIYRSQDQIIKAHTVFSTGIITLHVSIILGILGWALVTLKFTSLKPYATLFAVTPFLLFKIFFEMAEIRANDRLRKNNKY